MRVLRSVQDGLGSGFMAEVETHLANGLPTMQLIGFVGKSLDEAKDRIRSALTNSGLEIPKKKITCNVGPSDIPKDGSHYDLAIALSILQASKQVKLIDDNVIVIGELGLDGRVKPVRGILGKILTSLKNGYSYFIIPEENSEQAELIPSIHLITSDSLVDLCKKINTNDLEFVDTKSGSEIKELKNSDVSEEIVDLSEIVGQEVAKRALEIAASGQHNVLLSGPPGVGKSMLAKALIGIMPPLNREEVIIVTHLHSLVGPSNNKLITKRPIRSPHHTSSDIALIGGGQKPKPGEISLSHKGILFLDEFPEFRRSTVESLRQPLEDKVISLSRAQEKTTYPADFLLVATKNPCPCGYYGSTHPCSCTPLEIDRYQKKLSGPVLDRIDIHVTVDSIEHRDLLKESADRNSHLSKTVQNRVMKAVELQKNRFQDASKRNAHMTNKDIKKYASIATEAKNLLDTAAEKLDISARVYMKTIKLARTIADLDDSELIEVRHVSEALRYRPMPIS